MTPSSSLQATAGGPGSRSRRDGKASRRALNDREEGFMTLHPLAGQPVPSDMLIDVARLEREYYERKPDPSDPRQLVRFGTSGHRGTSFDGTLTEGHILAIAQAISDYRRSQGPVERRAPVPAGAE